MAVIAALATVYVVWGPTYLAIGFLAIGLILSGVALLLHQGARNES